MTTNTSAARLTGRFLRCLVGVGLALGLGAAHAAAIMGQGTWETTLKARDSSGNPVDLLASNAVFYYDTVLDLTWVRNWNLGAGTSFDDDIADPGESTTTDGRMTWASAIAFAAAANLNGFTGWMLPGVLDTGAPGCGTYSPSGADCYYNVYTDEVQRRGSPLAHMFYDTLGNLAAVDENGSDRPTNEQGITWGLVNTGPFVDMQLGFAGREGEYWTGYADPTSTNDAWAFNFASGYQANLFKGFDAFVVLVRPGDVYAGSVPEPGTFALLGLGLAGIGAVRRKRLAA
jgi:hypothetical protein